MTLPSPLFDDNLNRDRWIGYFDLLGIRSLVKSGDVFRVFSAYADAQKEARRVDPGKVGVFWFSDSFIFYSRDGSASDFVSIELICRWFCYFLTLKHIPVRGAISCGAMYVDDAHNLFFGPGLIDAYEYGESQDWIGFLLTPSAVKRLDEVGLPANERLDYAYWRILFKTDFAPEEHDLPACLFAGPTDSSVRDSCMAALAAMKAAAPQKVAAKYENTVTFLDRNIRHAAPQY
jgi:hypothetical protein